jgi:hypothetical protein
MKMSELEIRAFEVRATETEDRTVEGIAVPYGQVAEVGGYKERVAKGAFGSPENVTLYYGHDHKHGSMPIGKVVEFRDTDEGLYIKARIAKTAKGDEAYSLLREGVLSKFSIGFVPTKSSRSGDVIVREAGLLKEVSLVDWPAYTNAAVTQVRSEDADTNNTKETNMSENNTAPEVTEIRESVSALERSVTMLTEKYASNTPAPQGEFRNGGDFLKALAGNSESARMEVRAFTGATSADAHANVPAWVSAPLRLKVENRDVLNLFSRSALPASGNSIEYPRVSGVAGTVGAQVNEGDDLPYMEVSVATATAPVLTYGGYSSLSRQAIERSDIAYLDTVLRYQAQQYAKATNSAVRSALVGATGVNTGSLAANATAAAWLGLVLDSAGLIEDNSLGANAEFIVMSRNRFKALATLTDSTNRPLFDINNDGQNTVGNANLVSPRASVAGLPVVVAGGIADNTLFVASSDALTTYESAGAPFRLQDENIINLTKDFSLYGYMAVAVTNPLAVVKVTVA